VGEKAGGAVDAVV